MQKRLIQVVPYDEKWKGQFTEIQNVLIRHSGNLVIAIEHVGSTSVPGLAAKPILDINVIINNRDIIDEVISNLAVIGYIHQGDLGITGREAFKRINDAVLWDGITTSWPLHYLYLCDKNNPQLISQLCFRDYLRNNKEAAKIYGEVKIKAAINNPHDINGYMNEKSKCIQDILIKAKYLEEDVISKLNRQVL